MKLATDIMQKSTVTLPPDTQTYHRTGRNGRVMDYVFGGILSLSLVVIAVMAVLTFVHLQKTESSKPDSKDEDSMVNKMMLERLADELDRAYKDDEYSEESSNNVEANITYHLPGSGKTIEEIIVATDTEEDISTADIRIIFDYQNGHIVSRLYPSDNTTSNNVCFLRTFHPSEGTDMIKKILQTGKADEYVTHGTIEELYETTGEVFDASLLSDRAAEMCKNRDILLVSKKEETMSKDEDESTSIRKRRQSGCNGIYFCGSFCIILHHTREVRTCTRVWWRTRCKYVLRPEEETTCYDQCYCFVGLG